MDKAEKKLLDELDKMSKCFDDAETFVEIEQSLALEAGLENVSDCISAKCKKALLADARKSRFEETKCKQIIKLLA